MHLEIENNNFPWVNFEFSQTSLKNIQYHTFNSQSAEQDRHCSTYFWDTNSLIRARKTKIFPRYAHDSIAFTFHTSPTSNLHNRKLFIADLVVQHCLKITRQASHSADEFQDIHCDCPIGTFRGCFVWVRAQMALDCSQLIWTAMESRVSTCEHSLFTTLIIRIV